MPRETVFIGLRYIMGRFGGANSIERLLSTGLRAVARDLCQGTDVTMAFPTSVPGEENPYPSTRTLYPLLSD